MKGNVVGIVGPVFQVLWDSICQSFVAMKTQEVCLIIGVNLNGVKQSLRVVLHVLGGP